MADYHHQGHTVYDLKYHIVWTTKYRYAVLKGDVGGEGEGFDSRDLYVARGVNSEGIGCAGSCSRVGECTAEVGGEQIGAVFEGEVVTEVARGVRASEETVLGAASQDAWVFLCDGGGGR